MAEWPAFGLGLGVLPQQPQQTIHSASFCPLSAHISEHFIEHHEVVGAICLPLGLSLKEQLDAHHPLCLSD